MSCRWEQEIQKKDRSTSPRLEKTTLILSYYRRRNYRKCLQDDWFPSMVSSISLLKQRDAGNTATRTQISKGERSEIKIGTRVGTSLLLLLQNEWKDIHHWRSPWHHHARCRHRRIPAKHASTCTKHSTGVCCCCCCKGRQQRKRLRDWSR